MKDREAKCRTQLWGNRKNTTENNAVLPLTS